MLAVTVSREPHCGSHYPIGFMTISVLQHYNNLLLKIPSFLDADPKSVVCAYFKQGLCGKGDKCKYSHDITLERKGEKRSLYVDSRDDDLKNGKFPIIVYRFSLLL